MADWNAARASGACAATASPAEDVEPERAASPGIGRTARHIRNDDQQTYRRMTLAMRSFVLVLVAICAGCDAHPLLPEKGPPLRALAGYWSGNVIEGDSPILAHIICDDTPIHVADLRFRLYSPEEKSQQGGQPGTWHLELGNEARACITMDGYIQAVEYDYPHIRIQFDAARELTGIVSEESGLTIRGAFAVGDGPVPLTVVQE